MKTVYKYEIPINDHFDLFLPTGARILKADVQRGVVCLWALVDPSLADQRRSFRFAGTGHPMEEESLQHISTFKMDGDNLIFHIFEIR